MAIFDTIHGCTICYQLTRMYWGDTQLIYCSYLWLCICKFFLALELVFSTADNSAHLQGRVHPMEWAMRYGLMLQAFAYQRFFIYALKWVTGSYQYSVATIMCGMLCGFQAIGAFNATTTWLVCVASFRYLPKWCKPVKNKQDKLYLFSRQEYRAGVRFAVKKWGKGELLALGKRKDAKSALVKAEVLEGILDIDNDGLDKEEWAMLWRSLGLKFDYSNSDIMNKFHENIFRTDPDLAHNIYNEELLGAIRTDLEGSLERQWSLQSLPPVSTTKDQEPINGSEYDIEEAGDYRNMLAAGDKMSCKSAKGAWRNVNVVNLSNGKQFGRC